MDKVILGDDFLAGLSQESSPAQIDVYEKGDFEKVV
jgi:hypothetical protein